MAHPYHHALASVKKWGGEVSDYLALHRKRQGARPPMLLARIAAARAAAKLDLAPALPCENWNKTGNT